jgi:hypothetical protein
MVKTQLTETNLRQIRYGKVKDSRNHHSPSPREAVGGEVKRGQSSDVHGEHVTEEMGVGVEGAHDGLAQRRGATRLSQIARL